MGARLRAASVLIGFLLLFSLGANAQNSKTAYLTEQGNLSFKIKKTEFQILISPTGKVTNFAIDADGDIDFDMDGRLKKVGNTTISYDLDGRINRIGSEKISYDFENRVNQIGTTKISYSFITGKVDQISG
ncbi:hypothetical protein [Rufibacter hautae]|uniref:DUF4968 domain-containing protein n=1 Tax=Rufibacter hautae TaxID=2595005 RepID=A0A5B6T835_9BACT|nr:hypothetical protein [Rufibacter hautae]KAA3436318.1 hypothetical protein FOA19_18140 [Rufibacter hautae]